MASQVLRRFRPLVVASALAGTLVVPALAAATPPAPRTQPSIASVQQQLRKLAMQNSQLVETYNRAKITEARRAGAAHSATLASVAAKRQYSVARRQFVQLIQAQYEASGLGAAGALLDSNSGTNYLDRLDTLNVISNQTAQIVGRVKDAKAQTAAADAKAQQLYADAKVQRAAVGKKQAAVETQIAKYKNLLETLNAAQRARYARSNTVTTNPNAIQFGDTSEATPQGALFTLSSAGTSKAAQIAVKFALAQVGKPYVFGAAGPGAYDCSGLTMAAWHRAGVNLPHSAADQYNYGHHVSRDQLQPGDLIFFYQPIGHVTIYIGDGLMVSAPTEGEPVAVVPLASFNSDYAGATHLG